VALVPLDQPVPREVQVLKVQLGRWGLKVLRERQELLEARDPQGSRGCRVRRATLDQQELKVHRDQQVVLVLQDSQDQLERLAQLEALALPGHRVQQASLDQRVKLVCQAQLVC